MPLLIALLIGILVFLIGYNVVIRRQFRMSEAARKVSHGYAVEEILREADPKSAEYKLAAAGIRTNRAGLTLQLIYWGPALAILLVALALGLPAMVAAGLALVGVVSPRNWLDGRIKDRGRQIDADLPQVYVELVATLRASPDIANALKETADGLELDKGPSVISGELRLTANEAAAANIGRERALRNLQSRAASVSLANLALLLERFAQTGAGSGGSFFDAFIAGAGNVQAILEARQKAQSKAAEQMQSARIIPILLVLTLGFFVNDAGFRSSFQLPLTQVIMAGAVVVMFVGYTIMSDMAREAV